jgi:hypothetical protein
VAGGAGSLSISAGAASGNLGSLVFSNSNGVSFGLNGSTITGSVAAGAAATGISGIVVSNTTYTSGTVSFSNANGLSFGSSAGQAITGSYTVPGSTNFSNSNNVSFGLNGSTITATASVAAQTGISGIILSNTTYTSGTVSFSNANGVSFGSSAGQAVTVSYNSTSAVGPNTAQTNVTWTVNSSGISVNAAGYAGTATANTGLASFTLNSAGLSFNGSSLLGANTAQTNVTWTVNSSGISLNAGGYVGTGFTTGTTTGSWTATQNTAGLSMVMPYFTRFIWPMANLTPLTAPGAALQTIQYVPVKIAMTGSRLDALLAMSNSSSAGAGTVTLQFSQYAIIYTKNASTLSSLSSGSTQTTYTYASNTAGATYLTNSAIYPISVPINFNMVQGEYYVGFNLITSTTAASVTMSMMGGNAIGTALNYVEFANTATSTNVYGGMGVYSAATTGVVTRVSVSAINQTGSALSAANIALVFRNA